MTEDNLVFYLILVTFALAIGYGVYQWLRANKAKREHHHSVAERRQGANHASGTTAPQRKEST